MKEHYIFSYVVIAMLIGTTIYYTSKELPKAQEPKPCICKSTQEILYLSYKRDTFVDSLTYPRRKKDYPRYLDSLKHYNELLYGN